MTEKEAMELLREAHREPIAEAHYAAVRARVLSRLAEQRAPRWRWVWACGLAALATILFFAVGRTHLAPQVAPVARTNSISAPVDTPAGEPAEDLGIRPTLTAKAGHVRQPRKPPVYRVVGPPAVQPPLMVKLVTDDPNIVIYWLSGE